MESVDPLSAIRVSRTFFLRAWVQPLIPGIRSVNASAAATSGHVLFDVDELEVCVSLLDLIDGSFIGIELTTSCVCRRRRRVDRLSPRPFNLPL